MYLKIINTKIVLYLFVFPHNIHSTFLLEKVLESMEKIMLYFRFFFSGRLSMMPHTSHSIDAIDMMSYKIWKNTHAIKTDATSEDS
jgi:hypothetical protein